MGIMGYILGLYRDNGKEKGKYCLGFRGCGMFWAWLVGGDRLLDLALLSRLRRMSDGDEHKGAIYVHSAMIAAALTWLQV